MKIINKLIFDLLKTPQGKWSRTSIMMWICLVFSLAYLSTEFIKHGNFYIEAFYVLLGTATGLKYLGDQDKQKMAELKNDLS